MAFNPFHGFRKHSKVIFAILTIICMITFILSSGLGRGDFFDWLVGLVGASSRQGEVVTTLYGDKVHESQLGERERLRRIASDFVASAVLTRHLETAEETVKVLLQPEPSPESAERSSALVAFRRQASDTILATLGLPDLQQN